MRTDITTYISNLLNNNMVEVLSSDCKTIEDYLKKEDPRNFFDEEEIEDGYLSAEQDNEVTFFLSDDPLKFFARS